MKLRLNSSLRRAVMTALSSVAAATCGSLGSYAGTLHEDVSQQTYTDFGQNMGRYVTGSRVNALLSHIREQEGVTIPYTGGQQDYVLTVPMINFDSQADNGASAAIGYNFLATVQHNGVQNPAFTTNLLPAGSSVLYSGIEYRESDQFLLTPSSDYKITRLSKVITDVNPSALYTGTPKAGDMLYRSGSGSMTMRDKEGTIHSLLGAYQYATGGILSVASVVLPSENAGDDDSTRLTTRFNSAAGGISAMSPLPLNGDAGDSGSPVWMWNAETQRFEYVAAIQSVIGISGTGTTTFSWGAPNWSQLQMDAYNRQVDMASVGAEVFVSGQMTQGTSLTDSNGRTGELWTGVVTDGEGNILTSYNGVKSGVNTWNSLTELKDDDTWYAYGASYLNADAGGTDGKMTMATLFRTENLVFTSGAADNSVRIDENGVDLGVGYAQFSRTGEDSVSYTVSGGAFNHAGYIVDEGVSLHLISPNTDANNMREWRKVGAGDLYIEGTGSNEVFLNLGGTGTSYLNETDGYAAYNVLANTGSRVVLGGVNQIARDFTFGNGGAILDFNGHSMTWNNAAEVGADGFSIHALTEEAVITNSGDAAVTLRVTNGGDTFLGSFRDTATADLNIVYAGAGNWNLHGIATNLTHGDSGFAVESGSVTLSGTQTVHAMGSADGHSKNRLARANDWHYADAAMDVEVKGGTFVLGSHARLEGDVSVKEGGTFVMKEAVQHRMEYVEGGSRLEDTDKYAAYAGLKGDVLLDGGAMRVAFSEGTDAATSYGGNITGNASAVSFDLGTDAAIKLGGNNDFTTASGHADIISGGVIAEKAAAAGTDAHSWYIGEKGYLAVKGMSGSELLPHITTDSKGALVLTESQEAALPVHDGLYIGALEGIRVNYGAEGTNDELAAVGGKWLLGGGGGELVVNFALDNGESTLVLGNEYTTGSVTLSNENNNIGSIVFGGKVTLGYTSEAALGHATINLNYSNRVLGSQGTLGLLTSLADGTMLLDRMTSEDIDLSAHGSLFLGAAEDMTYTGTITPAGDTYRFGGSTGTLSLTQALTGDRNLSVDAQHYSGGVIELLSQASLTGAVTVTGCDSTKESLLTGGDITLRLSAADALASAASVTLQNGGILDINGTEQHLNSLTMEAGSVLTDSSARSGGTAVLNVGADETVALNGTVEVGTLAKTGTGTLNLGGDNAYNLFRIEEGTVALVSDTALKNAGTTQVQSGAVLDASAVSAGGQLALASGAELKVGAALDGAVHALSGTSIVSNNGGVTGLSSLIGVESGATLQLTGGTYRLTNASINEDSSIGGDTLTGGTLSVLAGRLEINGSATAEIGGTLSFDAASAQTLYSNRSGDNTTRNIAHLNIGGGADKVLTVTEATWNTIWNIHELTGEGTLKWDSSTTHWYSSRLVLDGENTFSGMIWAKRENSGSSVRPYASYIELAHDKAAQFAAVKLEGADANDYMNMAVNTDNASLLSLSGNEHTTLYAGAAFPGNEHQSGDNQTASGGMDNLPVSVRRATLAITGDASAEFKGNVYGGEDGNGISLVMNGATDEAVQKFTGEHIDLNDITVQRGTLQIFSTGLNLTGDVTLYTGAILQTGSELTLNAGQSLTVTGSRGATATLNSGLLFNGGTLTFDAAVLTSEQHALTAENVGTNTANITLSFTNTSHLCNGKEYKLFNGDWSAMELTQESFTVTGVDYLTSTFKMTESGLSVSFEAEAGTSIWDGTAEEQVWNETSFGQQAQAPTQGNIVVFNDAAACHDVHVVGVLQAGTLVFDNSVDYAIRTENGAVQTDDIHLIGSGHTTLGSGVIATGDVTVDNGSLMVQGAATLEQAQTVSGTGTLELDMGDGSVTPAHIGSLGALHLVSGQLGTTDTIDTPTITIDKGASLKTTADQTAAISIAGSGREGIDAAALILGDGVTVSGSVALTDDAAIGVSSGTATLSATVSGVQHSLTKAGAGALLLDTNLRSYEGDIIVKEGTLQIGNSSALGLNSPSERVIRVAEGAALDIHGIEGTSGYGYTVTLNGGTLTNSGDSVGDTKMQVVTDLVLTKNSGINAGNNSNFGLIAAGWGPTSIDLGDNTLEKTGAGTYYITNAAITGSGKLKVSEGTLQFDPRSSGHLDSDIEMAGGTLGGTVKLGDAITVSVTKSSELNAAFNTDGHDLTIDTEVNTTLNGAVSGRGSLLKTGSETLLLSSNSSFAGNLTVKEGTLQIGSNTAMGSTAGERVSVDSGASLDIRGVEGAASGYTVTLNGGTLTNTGNTLSSGQRQVVTGLKLTADSVIHAESDHDFGLIASGYRATSINLGTHTLEKTGAGTYYITNATFSGSGMLKVSEGTVQVDTRNNGSFAPAVEMADGTSLVQYNNDRPSNFTALASLTVTGSSATLQETHHAGALSVRSLSLGENVESAMLKLVNNAASTEATVYELGGGEKGNFRGTIELSEINGGASRSAVLVLNDAEVAQNARVELKSTISEAAKLGLGIHAEQVTVAGLSSGESLGNRASLFSGTANLRADSSKGLSLKDTGAVRTLTVNTANSTEDTFCGSVGANLKVVKTGTGTQAFAGDMSAFNGSLDVQQGILRLSGNAVNTLRSAPISVAQEATLHLSGTGSFAGMNWDASQALGTIELGNGTDNMTVKATAFSELNSKATLVINKNAQYDGGGTAAAPATLENDLILRTDASRIALHNVDVFNGDIAIEGTAVIASLQSRVNRTTTFNGNISGDTLAVGGGEYGAYQQFFMFSDKVDATGLEELHIGKSGNSNWTNVIIQGDKALAQQVSFDENCVDNSGDSRGRLFIEADSSTRTLSSAAGAGYVAVTDGNSLTVKDGVDFGGTIALGSMRNANSNELQSAHVALKGNNGGIMQTDGELTFGAATAEDGTKEASIIGSAGKGTRLVSTLIDLAAGTHLNLQEVVLAANSKLTDDTAYVNVQNVTLEAQVGFNAEQVEPVRVDHAASLRSSDGAGAPITMTSDSSVYSLKLNNVENVQLSGMHLSIALSGVEEETLQPHSLVSISLSGTATFDDSLDVVVTYNGYTAKGYYLEGNDNTVFVTVHDLTTPEPATATLSLLALAALAARRRRR